MPRKERVGAKVPQNDATVCLNRGGKLWLSPDVVFPLYRLTDLDYTQEIALSVTPTYTTRPVVRVGYTSYWTLREQPNALGGICYYRDLCRCLSRRESGAVNYVEHDFDVSSLQQICEQLDVVLSTVGQYCFTYYNARTKPLTIIRDCHTVGWWGHLLQEILCAPLTGPNDYVMFPTRYSQSVYERVLSADAPKTVAYGIVFPPKYEINRLREKRMHSDRITACFIGRLSWDKNFLSVVKAFLDARNQGAKIRLVVAGPTVPSGFGPDLDVLRGIIRKAGAEPDFEYRGYVSWEEKWRILSQSDMFIFPVTSAHESLCRTLVEAKYCGLAVISTNFGPVPELIHNGYTGVLLKTTPKTGSRMIVSGGQAVEFDYRDLVSAVVDTALDDSLLNRLKNVSSDVTDFYSMDNFLNRLETIIAPSQILPHRQLDRPLKEFTDVLKPEFLSFLGTDANYNRLLQRSAEYAISEYGKGTLLLGGCPLPEQLGVTLKEGLEEYLFFGKLREA